MTLAGTLIRMTTGTHDDRQHLVGWIVRDGIMASGLTFTQAADQWHISRPTLNRLMSTGNVGGRFYRIAEKQLDLPIRLLDYVADGDVDKIRTLPGLSPALRDMILGEFGEPPRTTRTRRQK